MVNRYRYMMRQIGSKANHMTIADVCKRRFKGIPRSGAQWTLGMWSSNAVIWTCSIGCLCSVITGVESRDMAKDLFACSYLAISVQARFVCF